LRYVRKDDIIKAGYDVAELKTLIIMPVNYTA